jgi:two-component system OmpR family response regulator
VKLLIIEDDAVLGRALTQGLGVQGYECQIATTGAAALKAAESDAFQVVILDLALADESGLGVLRCLREANENLIIIILTPLDFRQERLAGLEAGADDFLIKPFALDEMLARLEAALIRFKTRPKSMLEVGPITMDLTSRRVTRSGRLISLTPTEFRILEILVRNQSKVVTRRMLCEFLWQPEWEGVTNVIEVHINRLRSKLTHNNEARIIFTVRGSGYMLRWDPFTPDGSVAASDGEVAVTDGQSAPSSSNR